MQVSNYNKINTTQKLLSQIKVTKTRENYKTMYSYHFYNIKLFLLKYKY